MPIFLDRHDMVEQTAKETAQLHGDIPISVSLLKFVGQASLVDDAILPS